MNLALVYSGAAAAALSVLTVVVLLRAKRAVRDQLAARQEAREREHSEAALKAALLRSEAAEAQVRRGRHLLDTVATMARIGGWELDLATMRPIWSDEAYRIAELDPSISPSFNDTLSFFPPQARPRVEKAVSEALRNGTPYDLTVPFITRTGKHLWVRVMGVAETKNGVVTRLSGAMQDITQQREAEEARIAAKDAEAAAIRAKANFLANMSHEIRTPMNGVIGMTELLLDTPLESGQREFAETIRTSATSLLGIINDILDFSKIEAGKLEIERVPMHVRDCVEDIGMAMAVQAAAKELELIVNVDPGVPDRVLGDPARLRQVLSNLISNAIKFTHKGDVVVEVFPLALQNGRALLSFEVRDTGIGMPPEIVSQLFEPFVQADESSTRNYGGMGLGLAIVRRLVTLMGGRIDVSSRPGGGSAFTFSLPFDAIYDAADVVSTSRVITRGQGQGQYRGRVLVVEDNVVNQQVAKRFLQRLGCEAIVAENGQRGVDEYFRGQFGLVLMDVQMPVMDGLAAARAIRSREGDRNHVPIVALTASAMTDELERCTAAGMDGLLVKPLELTRLGEILDRYGFRSGVARGAPSLPLAASGGVPVLAPQPVDLDQLRTIVGDDREFMNELCETFVSSSTRIVEELTRALSAGDRAVLSAMAHKLKGGSASICAHELAKLAATLEKDAKEKPMPELERAVHSLRQAFDRAAGYVTAAIAA